MKFYFFGFFILLLSFSTPAVANEIAAEAHTTMKAEVLEVLDETEVTIPGTDTPTTQQTIRVKVLDGDEKGLELTVDNDYLNLKEGEVFYLTHYRSSFDVSDYYAVTDPYRLPSLAIFAVILVLAIVAFGGWQGIRGLISLILSLGAIFYVLFPAIVAGHSPILVSIVVASLITVVGSYITHGVNKTTSAAVLGMIGAIIVTGILAVIAVKTTRLSGFSSEEAMYLNFNTNGDIDLVGLLLGGILIGLLGVLYDAAISQAIAVEELHRVGPHLPRRYIFSRALRIGREHIGALVNTLAIAYVGVSLPLLLLFYTATDSFWLSVNREVFAAEIVRTIIGSIGLILAVPFTTLITTFLLIPRQKAGNTDTIEQERAAIEEMEHTHSHGHSHSH